MIEEKPTVVITGVSGYLGCYVALYFLKDGGFNVRGTVRNLNDETKLSPIKKACGDLYSQLTLIQADLLDERSIFAAIKGAVYVVHIASPCPIHPPEDEMEVIRPAVDGTISVMKASQLYKVKRVVLTSSTNTIKECKAENRPKNFTFNEENWSDTDGNHLSAYAKSKTLAERAAWDFQKKLPESERFELVVINQGFMFGPTFVTGEFTSGSLIKKFMTGHLPFYPRVRFGLSDVRTVAFAHLQALKVPEARNQRFAIVNEHFWVIDIIKAL